MCDSTLLWSEFIRQKYNFPAIENQQKEPVLRNSLS